jgi:hypothetical protein
MNVGTLVTCLTFAEYIFVVKSTSEMKCMVLTFGGSVLLPSSGLQCGSGGC